jgi:hypothetical protein
VTTAKPSPVTLLALDRSEGWFFFREGELILLIRPPYQIADRRLSSLASLSRAVQDRDFDAIDKPFDDLDKAIEFCRSEIIANAKREGRDLDAPVGPALIAAAPRIFIDALLNELEEGTHERQTRSELLSTIETKSRHASDPIVRERIERMKRILAS